MNPIKTVLVTLKNTKRMYGLWGHTPWVECSVMPQRPEVKCSIAGFLMSVVSHHISHKLKNKNIYTKTGYSYFIKRYCFMEFCCRIQLQIPIVQIIHIKVCNILNVLENNIKFIERSYLIFLCTNNFFLSWVWIWDRTGTPKRLR